MARPISRTDRFLAFEVAMIKDNFGTIRNAWTRLQPALVGAAVTWHQFRIAAGGGLSTRAVLEAIRTALHAWDRTSFAAPTLRAPRPR